MASSKFFAPLLITTLLLPLTASGREPSKLTTSDTLAATDAITTQDFRFDGYKNYWARDAWSWKGARGLFLQSQQTAEAALWAMEEEIGKQFMLEELWVQPGFIQKLLATEYTLLERPSDADFWIATTNNLLVTVTDRDKVGEDLLAKLPEQWQFRRNRAFYLEDGDGTVFVLASHTPEELTRLLDIVQQTLDVARKYDFHRGLSGVVTNYLHITPGIGRDPFELIQIARSLGCDWLTVNGYNDWMLAEPVSRALREIGDPFLFISGQSVTDGAMYGIERYPDVQDNTVDQCLDWAKEKGGHYFANLSAAEGEHAPRFQGYLVNNAADLAKINELDVPFMTRAGDVDRAAPPTMVVFLEKGVELSQSSLFEAIENRQAVAVFPEGAIAGPETLVTAMRFLLLEGTLLNERIRGPLDIQATIESGMLNVTVENRSTEPANVTLNYTGGPHVKPVTATENDTPTLVGLPPGTPTPLAPVPLEFTNAAGGHFNLIRIEATVDTDATGTPHVAHALASFKLPPVVSLHTLRYETPGAVVYPISVWNSSTIAAVDLSFLVRRRDTGEEVYRFQETIQATPWAETRSEVQFDVAAGDYVVEAMALGATTTGQLAVRDASGKVTVREEDLDGDGVPEIILESDTIRVALLMEGGRVIEYILKETGENLFFKRWPDTPPLDGTIGGTRSFYPYGGLEEFIGYPYIGGHVVYHHEILETTGDKGRVRVWANIHGSTISKVYTLYGGGPVLEATYAFQDMTPSIQTIGINPLFELGPTTGPEDSYYFPEEELVETRPEVERYYGRACFPKEGWAAGADPEANVSLVIGYPVNEAIYLHLWNNHPDNAPTPYYYTELQPWLQFNHGTTTYFSYYVLGGTSDWKSLAATFRDAGLVTERRNPKPWDY